MVKLAQLKIFHNIEIQDGSQLSKLCSKFADINRIVLNLKFKSNIKFKYKLIEKKVCSGSLY